MEPCPLCRKHPLSSSKAGDLTEIVCGSCGTYQMTSDVRDWVKDNYKEDQWKLAACVREKTLRKNPVVLFTTQKRIEKGDPVGSIGLDQLIELFPDSVADRLDRGLMNLELRTRYLGDRVSLHDQDFPTLFVRSREEVAFVLRQLAEDGFIGAYNSTFPCEPFLTTKAFNRVADLKRGLFGEASNQAFVAMSFDKSLDDAWSQGLKLGIEDCGYSAMRIDLKEHNGKICDEIIAEIRQSKFVVADFTLHRGGVYFEAGFMMGLGRPVVFTCKKDDLKDLHFDTRQYSHIVWSTPEELREMVKRRIQATIGISIHKAGPKK